MYRVKLNEHFFKNVVVDNDNSSVVLTKAVVTIGNFDGFHLGHLSLLSVLNKIAIQKQLYRIVITFEPSPFEYFCDISNKPRLPRLSLLRDKVALLKQQNLADELIIIRFNAKFSNLTPDEFIQQFLLVKFNMQNMCVQHLVLGHDFKFGKNRVGDCNYFTKYKIDFTVVDPVMIANNRVSSSLIRDLAKQNRLAEVKNNLGRNIRYTSKVIHGNHIGRTLGVPTINLSLGRNYPALWGIYLAYVYIDGVRYNAVASIGKNPTISGRGIYQLEAHLLDVDLNLYGKIATIEILEFMRNELKFNNMQELVQQMQLDLSQARLAFIRCNKALDSKTNSI